MQIMKEGLSMSKSDNLFDIAHANALNIISNYLTMQI